jgi:AraC-like DNA-binding protein
VGSVEFEGDQVMDLPDSGKSAVDEWTNRALSAFPVHCSYRTTSLNQPCFHSHSGYELYFCVQGSGRFIAGERLHSLGPGTFTAVRPMALHLSRPDVGAPFHRYVLAIERSYLETLYGGEEMIADAIGQWLPGHGHDSLHSQLNARQLLSLQETLGQLELEIRMKRSYYPLAVKSLLLQLFAELSRYRSDLDAVQQGSGERKRLVEDILSCMMEQYREPLRTEDLCRRFHLSRSYLHRIFKQDTGVAINEFMVAYRVNKAKELLQGTELPITEIAVSVGFQDISHFCHTFKRLAGMTPSRYRLTKETS